MMRVITVMCALSLLIGGVALMPSSASGAPWIAAVDSYSAPWLKEIEQEINKEDYRAVFMNDPRTPQVVVMKLLNRAAAALEGGNAQLAEQLVREAIDVLDQGARKNYFTPSDIEPIKSFIRHHAPVKLS
jgi:hypothetical protein